MAFLRVFVAQCLGEPDDVKTHLHSFCVPAEAKYARPIFNNTICLGGELQPLSYFFLVKPISLIDLCAHVVGKGPRVHVFIAREG